MSSEKDQPTSEKAPASISVADADAPTATASVNAASADVAAASECSPQPKPRFKWTIKAVESFNWAIDSGDIDKVKAYLSEIGATSLPQRKDDKYGGVDYEGHFSYTMLWGWLAKFHDVELYRFFRGMGMPLVNELEFDDCSPKRAAELDRSFIELYGEYSYGRKASSDGVPAADASAISAYLECLLDDGWAPIREGARPLRMDEFLLGLMPSDAKLWDRFIQAGFPLAKPERRSSVNPAWQLAFNLKRFEALSFLAERGLGPDCAVAIGPKCDLELLDAALSAGAPIEYVQSDCSGEVLIRCAQNGAKPILPVADEAGFIVGDHIVRPYIKKEDLRRADFEICRSLDHDVIKAFCENDLLEYKDTATAKAAGRADIVELLEGGPASGAGVAAQPAPVEKTVGYALPYLHGTVVDVPEGVERIEADTFEDLDVSELRLPSTLSSIDERIFGRRSGVKCRRPSTVVIPPSVRTVGRGAMYGVRNVVVYDTIDADIQLKIDDLNGVSDTSIGWLGILPYKGYAVSIGNSHRSNFEVTVKSAETDEVKYRVWLPMEKLGHEDRCVLASAWGPRAEFDFGQLDSRFDRLPNKESKVKTALNRLRWPVELSPAGAEKYEAYLVKFKKDAVLELIREDDLETLERLGIANLVNKRNVDELIFNAKAGDVAPRIAERLGAYRQDDLRMKAPAAKPFEEWDNRHADDVCLLAERGDHAGVAAYFANAPKGKLPRANSKLQLQARLWAIAKENLDAELLKILGAKGLNLNSQKVQYRGWEAGFHCGIELRESLMDWACDCARVKNRTQAVKGFILQLLDLGLSFEGHDIFEGEYDECLQKEFVKGFADSPELFAALEGAGLSFEGWGCEIPRAASAE